MFIHLFLFVSLTQESRNVRELYNSFILSGSTELDLIMNLGSRAFASADRDVCKSSIIHVPENNRNKDFTGDTLSTSAVVISGTSVRINFDGSQKVNATIWLIAPHDCSDRFHPKKFR
jgi:hypothetical protein